MSTDLSKPLFEKLLAAFARGVGAGHERHIVLVLVNAGWQWPWRGSSILASAESRGMIGKGRSLQSWKTASAQPLRHLAAARNPGCHGRTERPCSEM